MNLLIGIVFTLTLEVNGKHCSNLSLNIDRNLSQELFESWELITSFQLHEDKETLNLFMLV